MKPGLFGQRLSVMEELRAATFAPHARIQTAPFFAALAACQLPLESYVGQLRSLAIVHGVLERALDGAFEHRVAAVWRPGMRRLGRLQQDLGFFEPRAVADISEAGDIALATAEDLRLRTLDDPLSLLGPIYVLEGSMLGARVLHPLYARAFLLAEGEGLNYLGADGDAAPDRWAQFAGRMNTLVLSDAERERIGAAANALFERLGALYRALYPFQPESRTFLATSINPEAGRHPVPADDREIRAALQAADRCWARFPYFEARYGERGRRFARSDAAWLATLHAYDPSQMVRQVRWLGRVLAGRGMPTLLLQDQLDILAAELAAAIPRKQPEFDRLRLAAAELADARRGHLNDGQVASIVTAFKQAVDPDLHAAYPYTAELLACAVADEREGMTNAVESIQSWFVDSTRFSPEWAAAIEHCIERARTEAGPRQEEEVPV